MSEPKQASPKNGNGAGAGAAAAAGAPPHQDAPHEQSATPVGAELRQRIDQVGTILAKGLDLAEAGVSLGVTILGRVGVAAQQKIREGLDNAAAAAPPPEGAPPDTDDVGEGPADEAEPAYGLTNRLPLAPGGEVKISFSVNNDSMTEPKKVDLHVEDFFGDTQGGRLDAVAFAVKPAQKTIAPVDFEKFVLQGAVPAQTPPDIYRGAVIVASDKALKIPVVLVVTPL